MVGTLCWSNIIIFSSTVISSMESAINSCYTFLEGCYSRQICQETLDFLKLHIYDTCVYICVCMWSSSAFLDWHRFCTVCSKIAFFSSKCCTSLKEILQVIMLLQSFHRHVVLVYSKKLALHCFKQFSTVFKKVLHLLKVT